MFYANRNTAPPIIFETPCTFFIRKVKVLHLYIIYVNQRNNINNPYIALIKKVHRVGRDSKGLYESPYIKYKIYVPADGSRKERTS